MRPRGRLRTLRDLPVENKRVFVRVDFNVPLSHDRQITDDTRIRAALPTIEYLLGHGAAVILASHLGRPKGARKADLSLAPVAERLTRLLNRPVRMAPDCVGAEIEELVRGLSPGDILLLENLRFHPEEEKNDAAFASQLARLADIYVDDAFGAAHRAHASTEGLARLLPSTAGLLMEREVEELSKVLRMPTHPFTAIIGGAKISTKIGVIENLLERVDKLLIGGAMANTFFLSQGLEVGESLVEPDQVDAARRVLAGPGKDRLLLPVDLVIARDISNAAETRVAPFDAVPTGWSIVDIGPESVDLFGLEIDRSRLILWNGPMGIFETPEFAKGTLEIARRIAGSQAESIVGGGDSVAALEQMGLADRMTHVSTGGGASLEFLEGIELPGITVLRNTPS